MSLEGIGLFTGLKSRLDYINKAQTLVSQNIANADTPDYTPQELREFDFSRVVESSRHDHTAQTAFKPVKPLVTNVSHINSGSGERNVRGGDQDFIVETAPSGNAVDLESQILRATQNSGDYTLMLNVLRKNVQMIRTATNGVGR